MQTSTQNFQKKETPKRSRLLKIIAIILLLLSLATNVFFYYRLSKQAEIKSITPSDPSGRVEEGVQREDSDEKTDSQDASKKITSWKTIDGDNFLFEYPGYWRIDRKRAESVVVSNYLGSCEGCTSEQKQNYHEFSLHLVDEQVSHPKTKDALEYILSKWLEFTQSQNEQKAQSEKPSLPVTPGFTQKYIADAIEFFPDSEFSIVEVQPFHYSPAHGDQVINLEEREFVIIDDSYRVFTLNLIGPNLFKQDQLVRSINSPFDRMIRSLTFF